MTEDTNKVALQEEKRHDLRNVQFVEQRQKYMSKDGIEILNYVNSSDIQHAMLQERAKAIEDIKQDAVAVGELFQTTAALLAEQHQQLDVLEQNILQTEAQSEEAVLTLAKVHKHSRRKVISLRLLNIKHIHPC
jgi:hypothetical protein